MRKMICLIASLVAVWGAVCCAPARAEAPAAGLKTELLWPQGAPGAKGTSEADQPKLVIALAAPENATKAAVVICPGGGYGTLAMGHEGYDVAKWLNSLGVAGFIVTYRHAPQYQHPAPLEDAQRAIRTVRSRAAEFKIDPARIGILGFSAGGHLASTAATHFAAAEPDSPDPIQRVGSRPDFAILVYPVISLTADCTHQGSKRNLLGPNPDPKLVESLSNEKQVTPETPPAFLIHTSGDTGVPAENSILFYLAMRRAKVPAEMHIYEQGQHGFGLAPKDPVLSSWPGRCADWMRARGLLKKD